MTKRNSFGKNQIPVLSTYKAILSCPYEELMKVSEKDISISQFPIDYEEYCFIPVWIGDKDSKGQIQLYYLNLSSTIPNLNKEETNEWEVDCCNKEILRKFLNYFPNGDKVEINTTTFSIGDKVKIKSKYDGSTKMCVNNGKFFLVTEGFRCSIKGDDPTGKEGVITELKETYKGNNYYNVIIDFPGLALPSGIDRLEKI